MEMWKYVFVLCKCLLKAFDKKKTGGGSRRGRRGRGLIGATVAWAKVEFLNAFPLLQLKSNSSEGRRTC